jgi:hypothetical protein
MKGCWLTMDLPATYYNTDPFFGDLQADDFDHIL